MAIKKNEKPPVKTIKGGKLPNVTVTAKKPNPNSVVGKGRSNQLQNVTVTAKRSNPNPMNAKGPNNELEEVFVREKSLPRKGKALPMIPVDSSKRALPKIQAPEGKKMGRGRTALNDATSMVRGAANVAFGKNKSKTTGGKILERGARLIAGGTGLYSTGGPQTVATYANRMQKATNKVTGYVQKGAKAASKSALKAGLGYTALGSVVAPALIGQIDFKNRSEESKKRGIMNPGKNNSFGINFDKPFQKKAAASDSTSKSKKK